MNFFTGIDFIKRQKFISQEDLICNKKALNKSSYFYDRMRLEIFPFACKKY